MEELAIKELMAKEILVGGIVPTLRKIIEEKSPEEFAKWGGNCCRQTAFVCKAFLDIMLPNYEWSIWDGIFDDIHEGKPVKYNHAWVYGVTKQGEKQRLFVDLARIHKSDIFMVTQGNRYPKNDPEYKDLVELKREKLDFEQMGNINEYFTKMTGKELLKEIQSRLGENV